MTAISSTLHGPAPTSPWAQIKASSTMLIAELKERRQIEASTTFDSAFSKTSLGL